MRRHALFVFATDRVLMEVFPRGLRFSVNIFAKPHSWVRVCRREMRLHSGLQCHGFVDAFLIARLDSTRSKRVKFRLTVIQPRSPKNWEGGSGQRYGAGRIRRLPIVCLMAGTPMKGVARRFPVEERMYHSSI
jgi:hypothetical protein